MGKRAFHVVAFSVGVVTVILVGGVPAQAQCLAPAIVHTHEDQAPGNNRIRAVDRGERITVEGLGWGDRCYDTGVPEDALGVLGDPVAGMEVLVAQEGLGHPVLVAKGNADRDYGFVASFVVPVELAPGAAKILVRISKQPDVVRAAILLEVSTAAPRAVEANVARFGPTEPIRSDGSDGEQPLGWWVPVGLSAGAAALLFWRRRSDRHSDAHSEIGADELAQM